MALPYGDLGACARDDRDGITVNYSDSTNSSCSWDMFKSLSGRYHCIYSMHCCLLNHVSVRGDVQAVISDEVRDVHDQPPCQPPPSGHQGWAIFM